MEERKRKMLDGKMIAVIERSIFTLLICQQKSLKTIFDFDAQFTSELLHFSKNRYLFKFIQFHHHFKFYALIPCSSDCEKYVLRTTTWLAMRPWLEILDLSRKKPTQKKFTRWENSRVCSLMRTHSIPYWWSHSQQFSLSARD